MLNSKTLVFTFTGDVMIGRAVNEYLKAINKPEAIWGNTLVDLQKSDLVFINLECALTKIQKQGEKEVPVFFFRSEPENVASLVSAGVDYAALANNHILDFGKTGLRETIETLIAAKIKYSGAGENLDQASQPAELECQGMKIKVFSLTDNEPCWEAAPKKAGTYYLPIETKDKRFKRLIERISQAKKQNCLVIVSAHWGPNMVRVPPKHHMDFAHGLIDAGVDIFHGHSSHVFQPVEIYKKKVIFYDGGEMIDDYAVDPFLRNDQSFLYQVILDQGQIQKVILKPVRIEIKVGLTLQMAVNKVFGQEAEVISQKMIELSKSLVPNIVFKDNQLEIMVV